MNESWRQYLLDLATDRHTRWYDRVLQTGLRILSWGYGLGVRLTRTLYTSGVLPRTKSGLPVISVGNLTVGGVGKTPIVVELARYLQKINYRPAVLLRGYMADSSTGMSSDEEVLLRNLLPGIPVLSGASREELAHRVESEKRGDVIILDDGFQRWPMRRDLDIVVIDCQQGFGNRCLLPRGILREPMNALKRADAVVLTKTDLGAENIPLIYEKIRKYNHTILIVESVHQAESLVDVVSGQRQGLDALRDAEVALLCAIGSPDSFNRLARRLGARVRKDFRFLDHHVYTEQDIDRLVQWVRDNRVDAVVTTAKDSAKLKPILIRKAISCPVYALNIRVRWTKGGRELESLLDDLMQKTQGAL